MIRYLAGFLLSKHSLVQDTISMAVQRDGAFALAEENGRIADMAVAKAARYHKQLAETQAQLDSLTADFEAYVLEGERRG